MIELEKQLFFVAVQLIRFLHIQISSCALSASVLRRAMSAGDMSNSENESSSDEDEADAAVADADADADGATATSSLRMAIASTSSAAAGTAA